MGVDYQTHRCRIGYFRTLGYSCSVAVKGREQVFLGEISSQHAIRSTMAGFGYRITKILPLCVILIQLLISGLEPNPGPITAKNQEIELNKDSDFGSTRDFQGPRIPFVQPQLPSVSVAEVTEHGCPLFMLEMNSTRKTELRNKNKSDLQQREFLKVLDDIHNLSTRTELEISPLIYISKRNLFLMFPMSPWWERLHFSECVKCPSVGLAYLNDTGQCLCCTDLPFEHLENRIYTEEIKSIKHDELMPILGGFERLRQNRNNNSRPNISEFVFNNPPFDFKQKQLNNFDSQCMIDLNGVCFPNNYIKWNHRIDSLIRFTTSTTESQRQELCAAGFFSEPHSGSYDRVRCFCCGVGLTNLSDLGNPLLAHVKYSPNCPFLLECSKQLRESINVRQRERNATHTGFEYQCKCFSCGGVVNEWKPVEDSRIHCKRFPYCSYAKEDKGDEFINLLECAKQLTEVESLPKDYQTNCAITPVNIDERVFQQVVNKHQNVLTSDMGFPEDDIRNAVLQLVQGGLENPDIEDIVMHLQTTNDRECLIEQFKSLKPQVPATTGALLEKNQHFCLSCTKNPVNALFLPCTHHKFCNKCTDHSDTCTDCGRPIKQRIPTYIKT